MIEARAVRFERGGRALVEDASLDARAGEVLGLVGPNGAGKTTLLGVLAGDLQPSAGEVTFDGAPMSRWSEAELARRRAVMAQSTEVAFAFTVLEIVLFGRAPFGARETAEDVAIAREAIARVGLEALARRPYPTLSGGEQQRVHLARVLAQIALGRQGSAAPEQAPPSASRAGEARALLLDEPTSSLDPAHQHRTLALAREIADRGLAVVAVLHDLNLASRYCDRVALMHRGRVVALGAPREVFEPRRLEEVFEISAQVGPAPWNPGGVAVHFAPM